MRVLRLNDDEGAIALLVAMLSVVIFLMAAFAVDVGSAYANARQLSVAADSAALQAAAAVGEKLPIGSTCTSSVLSSIGAQATAQAAADKAATDNNRFGASDPVAPVVVTCTDGFVQVDVSNTRVIKTTFGALAGISTLNPNAEASARYVRVPTTGALRPWAVCDATVVAAQDEPDKTFATWLDNKEFGGTCGSDASGNWGGVDFDGGNNAAGDLADWTLDGYPGSVDIPDPVLPADPGVSNSAALGNAFEALVGQIIMLPSVTGIQGGGNNATFNAVGIASIKVCGIRYANSTYNVGSDCWDPALAASIVDDKNKPIDHIQFRWVNYTTSSYTGGTTTPCASLTNRQCVGSTLLWR